MSAREAEFADFASARLASLRRLAMLLSQDWQRADDLVQAALIKLYVKWPRAIAANNIDAYARAIVVREFLDERRSSWHTRVTLSDQLPDRLHIPPDTASVVDLEVAMSALTPRQRATVVLRFYLDLNVDQTAQLLGCTRGTVKSQTAKALSALRRTLAPEQQLLASAAVAEPRPTGKEAS
jgi:RNA polymerase sigma-70 factor (sigma-E family)